MNKISVITSYHDINIVNFNILFEQLLKVGHDIYPLNTNYQTTETLNKLKSKYGHNKGVVFDEFNTQSYFVENIHDKNDYVYHTHYRRYFINIDSNIELDKNIVYVSNDDRSLFELLKIIFDDSYTDDILNKIILIFSQVFNISFEDTHYVLMSETPSPVREMYVCHKDIQKEMVEYMYKFIDVFCSSFNDDILNIKRIVGYMIELAQGFYFKKLALIDNYKLYLLITTII